MLIFFRTVECRKCRQLLRAIAAHYGEYQRMEAEVLAMSADEIDHLRQLSQDLALPLPVLIDSDGRVTDLLFRNPFIWVVTAIVIGLQLMAIYWSSVAHVLDTVPLNREHWYVIGFATIAPIVIVEITKLAGLIRLRRHALSA